MTRFLQLAGLFAVLALAGCGGHAKKPAPSLSLPGASMPARLRAHGYQVGALAHVPGLRYGRGFAVAHLDWASTHAFTVDVYVFASHAQARVRRKLAVESTGNFPSLNRSRLVGSTLFVATVDTGGALCVVENGKLVSCPKTSPIPVADFDRVVSVATG